MAEQVLSGLWVPPGQADTYTAIVSAIKDQNISLDIVTNEMVLELRVLVIEGRITIRQFSHILAFLSDKAKFEVEETINKDLKKALYNSRDLDRLAARLERGEVEGGAAWRQLARVFPEAVAALEAAVGGGEGQKGGGEGQEGGGEGQEEKEVQVGGDDRDEEMGSNMKVDKESEGVKRGVAGYDEAAGGKVRRLEEKVDDDVELEQVEEEEQMEEELELEERAESKVEVAGSDGGESGEVKLLLPHLTSEGLQSDSSEEVVRLLQEMARREEVNLSNGVVMETIEHFGSIEVGAALVNLIMGIVKVHKCHQDRQLRKKVRKYVMLTRARMEEGGGEEEDPWLYLARLGAGGDLDMTHLQEPASCITDLAQRVAMAAGMPGRRCQARGCGMLGDFRICKVSRHLV